MLELANLESSYGDSTVLHGISLQVPRAARVAVIGRNGAGKSTLLKSILNAGPSVKGNVTWNGRSLKGRPSHVCCQEGIALVPEDRRILAELTVAENLSIAARAYSSAERARAVDVVIERFPILIPIKDRLAGLLSGGQQQILAIARAALARPQLLMVDEATEGLAPVIVEALVADVLRICREQGCALLLCEQNIWFSRQCCEFVYVIDTGKIVFFGTWDEFDRNPQIKSQHLSL